MIIFYMNSHNRLKELVLCRYFSNKFAGFLQSEYHLLTEHKLEEMEKCNVNAGRQVCELVPNAVPVDRAVEYILSTYYLLMSDTLFTADFVQEYILYQILTDYEDCVLSPDETDLEEACHYIDLFCTLNKIPEEEKNAYQKQAHEWLTEYDKVSYLCDLLFPGYDPYEAGAYTRKEIKSFLKHKRRIMVGLYDFIFSSCEDKSENDCDVTRILSTPGLSEINDSKPEEVTVTEETKG